MKKIKLCNFSGEIEWLVSGDSFVVDIHYRAIEDLIQIALSEIKELAQCTYNKPINEHTQVPMLRALLEKRGHRYEELYISDANGNYFNAHGQKNNIMDRVYFHKVMKRDTVVSEPIINKSTGRPCIAVATPILYRKKVIGLFGATILLESTHKGIRYLPLGKTQKAKAHKKGAHTAGNKMNNDKQITMVML